jgi:TetR/AcrR family transcriptional regulator, regulator of cefoperazone and chloramphenicol sensitivity
MRTDQRSAETTRQALIEAAAQVFAEVGFQDATVREICSRARANVAAVNYHFGGKLGLYTEVLKSAMLAQQETTVDRSFANRSEPRAGLRALINAWMERARADGKSSWFARIMAHEMSHLTPALDLAVEAMTANYLRLRVLVGNIIQCGPDDPQTRMCVHSVVGQVLQYVQSRPMLERLWPDLDLNDDEQRRAIADHIMEFSLGGMERIAQQKADSRRETRLQTSEQRSGRRL